MQGAIRDKLLHASEPWLANGFDASSNGHSASVETSNYQKTLSKERFTATRRPGPSQKCALPGRTLPHFLRVAAELSLLFFSRFAEVARKHDWYGKNQKKHVQMRIVCRIMKRLLRRPVHTSMKDSGWTQESQSLIEIAIVSGSSIKNAESMNS